MPVSHGNLFVSAGIWDRVMTGGQEGSSAARKLPHLAEMIQVPPVMQVSLLISCIRGKPFYVIKEICASL